MLEKKNCKVLTKTKCLLNWPHSRKPSVYCLISQGENSQNLAGCWEGSKYTILAMKCAQIIPALDKMTLVCVFNCMWPVLWLRNTKMGYG